MKFELNHYSLILLVGPTGCGKTPLVTDMQKVLADQGIPSIHISSDQERRNLLGSEETHKHSPEMMEVSKQAFEMLTAKVNTAVSYPVNIPFVFVDTRGFDATFRKEMSDIAFKNHYNLVCISFEFKNASDYLDGLTEAEAFVTKMDVQKFRKKVLPELRSRDFSRMLKVKRNNQWMEGVELDLPDQEAYLKSNLVDVGPVAVIGDSHECLAELKALITNLEEKTPGIKIIHAGDYLDKGGNTEATIEYMEERTAKGDIIVSANHEMYLYRRLKRDIEPADPEVENTYFTALPFLLKDDSLRERFFALVENHTVPFVKVTNPNQRTMYVTHAPCKEVFLGKFSFAAQRAQRNLYMKDRQADLRSVMDFIYQEASPINPTHVFGHVSHSSPYLAFRNKVFLDTGCVNGGALTAFVLKDNNYSFVQEKSQTLHLPKELPDNLTKPIKEDKPFSIYDYNLSVNDYKFINKAMSNGIKYISGTMAPAPSTATELEPLSAAFKYFHNKGIDQVVLEPKYMGSRCQFYLYKNPEKPCFAVSRNGFVIRHVEGLDVVLEAWRTKCQDWYDGSWSEIILDGELLPWSALGKGLIDHEFYSYHALIQDELQTLKSDQGFAELEMAKGMDVEGRLVELQVFKETLDLYGKDYPLEYKAFNILSSDGQIVGGTPEVMFETLGEDPFLVVDLNNEESIAEGQKFFQVITVEKGMEGLVVKPFCEPTDRPSNVPEYMKVRNEKYLTLVYGYDYKRKYHKLVSQKNISGKVAVSIKESQLATRMLTAKDEERKELFVKMLAELKKETSLDPRL